MAFLWSLQNWAKVTHITLTLLLPTANREKEKVRDAGVKGNRDKAAAEQGSAVK